MRGRRARSEPEREPEPGGQGAALEFHRLRWALRPLLGEVSAGCGESVGFGRLRHRQAVLEECVSPPGAAHRALVGVELPVYASALGKALLAFSWADARGLGIGCSRLVRHARNTIRTREELWRRLEIVRHRGFAIEDEELRDGVRAICVPVWGAAPAPVGGLVIEGPVGRFGRQRMLSELVPLAFEARSRLACLLSPAREVPASRVA